MLCDCCPAVVGQRDPWQEHPPGRWSEARAMDHGLKYCQPGAIGQSRGGPCESTIATAQLFAPDALRGRARHLLSRPARATPFARGTSSTSTCTFGHV